MDNDSNFEIFLFVSEKKMIIYVNSETNLQIYKKELILEETSKGLNFDRLDFFLNENIFKIEKVINGFVKKIILILDYKDFFSVDISIKKNNYEDTLNLKSLNYLLYELRDYCKDSTYGTKITHMIIQNYLIDKKSYSFFPENMKCNSFSLDVRFICLSSNLIKKVEKILKKYQVSLKHVVNSNYITKFLNEDENNIFLATKKVIAGYNPNEVMLVDKIKKNQGFFEKFFSYFS